MMVRLRIENMHSAEPGVQPGCAFSNMGGLIGASSESTWRVQDTAQKISENAARIVVIDQHFTLEAIGTEEIRINGAMSGIPKGRPVVLNDKDEFFLGSLRITVSLAEARVAQDGKGLAGLIDHRDRAAEALIADADFDDSVDYPGARHAVHDPIAAFSIAAARSDMGAANSVDPLLAFDAPEAARAPASMQVSGTQGTRQSDSRFDINSVVIAPRFRLSDGDRPYDDFDELDAELVDIRPLTEALGFSFELQPSQSNVLLAEIGTALRIAVEGLNRLYASQKNNENNFSLANMHLHIEDNPLCSASSGQEAMSALFTPSGSGQTSPSAALAECLEHLSCHQDAAQAAAGRALSALISALEPDALERRFSTDAEDAPPATELERDAWCWQKYKAHLTETSSPQRKELQDLFWEALVHEYRASMRSFANGEGRNAQTGSAA